MLVAGQLTYSCIAKLLDIVEAATVAMAIEIFHRLAADLDSLFGLALYCLLDLLRLFL